MLINIAQMKERSFTHDAFISHSSKDKAVADAVCAGLEANGVRCWIAPRDIMPGRSWPEAITGAIETSPVTVVIFSANANESEQVTREVADSVNQGSVILPFKIENIIPSKSMRYFLSTPHWLDAITPPLETHIRKLVLIIKNLVAEKSAPNWKEEATNTRSVQLQSIDLPSEGPVALDDLVRKQKRGGFWSFFSNMLDDK